MSNKGKVVRFLLSVVGMLSVAVILLFFFGIIDSSLLVQLFTIFILAFIQNVSFSVVSRSRNRDNFDYHVIAAFFSNSIWFLTFRQLVRGDMNLILFAPYVLATLLGSVYGVKISMYIEKRLGASADNHLTK